LPDEVAVSVVADVDGAVDVVEDAVDGLILVGCGGCVEGDFSWWDVDGAGFLADCELACGAASGLVEDGCVDGFVCRELICRDVSEGLQCMGDDFFCSRRVFAGASCKSNEDEHDGRRKYHDWLSHEYTGGRKQRLA